MPLTKKQEQAFGRKSKLAEVSQMSPMEALSSGFSSIGEGMEAAKIKALQSLAGDTPVQPRAVEVSPESRAEAQVGADLAAKKETENTINRLMQEISDLQEIAPFGNGEIKQKIQQKQDILQKYLNKVK